MLLLYTKMFMILNEDRKSSVPGHVDKDREDMVLAVRFFFIVFTDCLCWLPIVLIKILAFANPDLVSPTVYAWVVVFILPINSAINPIIYTIAAPTAIRRQIKHALKRLPCPAVSRCCRVRVPLAKRNSSTTSTTTGVVILSPRVAADLLVMSGRPSIINENEIKRSSSGSVMSVVTMSTMKNNVSTCSSRRNSSVTVTTTLGRGSFNTSLPIDNALTAAGQVIIESPSHEEEEVDNSGNIDDTSGTEVR